MYLSIQLLISFTLENCLLPDNVVVVVVVVVVVAAAADGPQASRSVFCQR